MKSVTELSKKLYKGSAQRVRERLLDRGISFSQQYISRCLKPDRPDYNQIIIEEAIKVGEEDTIQMNELCHRIKLLNDPS